MKSVWQIPVGSVHSAPLSFSSLQKYSPAVSRHVLPGGHYFPTITGKIKRKHKEVICSFYLPGYLQGLHLGKWGGREDLGGGRRKDTIVRLHCMKTFTFNFKEPISNFLALKVVTHLTLSSFYLQK